MRRFRLTYANVVSTMALILALGGGAYAATSQGTAATSKTQRLAAPAVITTAKLMRGQTERGVFDVGGMETTGATPDGQLGAVSFAYPLSFVPKGQILNPKQKTKACPGTVGRPTAKPGHLCIYEGGNWNINSVAFLDPRTQGSVGITALGFVLIATPYVAGGSYSFDWHGTWAVTAP